MKRRTLWTLVLAFALANGGIVAMGAPATAEDMYLDCFWFVGGKGCTWGIVDVCTQSLEQCPD